MEVPLRGTVWVAVAACLFGCRPLRANVEVGDPINQGARSVAVDVIALRKLPPGLGRLDCEAIRGWDSNKDILEAMVKGEGATDQFLLGRGAPLETPLDSMPGRDWLLFVPRWERCDDATPWALVRAGTTVRSVYVELSESRISLSWEPRKRQRGWTGGVPHHVLLPAPRARK
jgi:hypothetical protein